MSDGKLLNFSFSKQNAKGDGSDFENIFEKFDQNSFYLDYNG